METWHLRAFLAVAEDLHFGRAARRLHVAQPHLSRTVRALEDELGAPLFHRTTRRVRLTPAGEALVEPAGVLLGAEGAARASVKAAQEGRTGRVRIGFAGPSSQALVGRLSRAVREQHPLIDLELRPGSYGIAAVADLAGHEADLVIARFPEPPPGVAWRILAHDRCVLAVPERHRLSDIGTVRVGDLRDEPLVALPEHVGSAVRALLMSHGRAAGFSPRVVQTAPDSWTCVALVAAGVGLHLTMASALEHLPLDGVRILEVADLPVVSVFLLWREDDSDPTVRRVLAVAQEVLVRLPP